MFLTFAQLNFVYIICFIYHALNNFEQTDKASCCYHNRETVDRLQRQTNVPIVETCCMCSSEYSYIHIQNFSGICAHKDFDVYTGIL